MNIEDTIKEMIIRHFMAGEENPQLPGDVSFLEKGIIDSTGVLEQVTFLDGTFDNKVEDEEMVPENLDSVNHLVRFVNRKLEKEKVNG